MRVLVVGGAGYIGSHVVRALLDQKHEVAVYDNLSLGCRENLFPEARFVLGDILDAAALSAAMACGVDAVMHLAAFKAAGESMIHPEKYAVNNITGTINLLNAACEIGVRRLVFSSSAAVYGEPRYVPVDEAHPCNPVNFYGFTKLEIERLLEWYERLRGLRFASLRYFNAAGYDVLGRVRGLERHPANLLPVIMETAAGRRDCLEIFGDDYATEDGTGVRDYIHVNDLAGAHLLALEYVAQDRSLIVNLGSETGISVRAMLETARRLTGRTIPACVVARRPGDPPTLVASSKNARQVLGWRPKHSDAETLIASAWAAYQRR
ncbi:MAG: UDP-glucose 4-epimerase GalE [Vicinamibacteria bacterium]|nr:UDP-glucose 4-epimerase GalE [Vicinamibacteria bacterium]